MSNKTLVRISLSVFAVVFILMVVSTIYMVATTETSFKITIDLSFSDSEIIDNSSLFIDDKPHNGTFSSSTISWTFEAEKGNPHVMMIGLMNGSSGIVGYLNGTVEVSSGGTLGFNFENEGDLNFSKDIDDKEREFYRISEPFEVSIYFKLKVSPESYFPLRWGPGRFRP
jgi:hypothetical protein